MTAELFDRLLYTDCVAGAGRGAGGGFQVQAQSSGVDAEQAKLAVSSLLYEVQMAWLSQGRPVGEFPLGFAHASGEGYGTAQGLYVGKTAAGGRDGNHLTDCLLTRDQALYGPVRPAQLWRSPLWRSRQWDSRECPRFDAAGLEPGPLTVEAVADWARAVPARGPVLARLLTVLEEPGGRHVVILADGPDEAMTWIAAATLLLPARQALNVSFKVFSSIPLRTELRVAAAPAALFPQLGLGRSGGAFVLDAVACAADETQASERALFFTSRFTADEDPYDVVDAVELASLLGGGALGKGALGGRDAMLTAWAVTRSGPDGEPPEPDALLRWLSGAAPPLLDEHGPAVAELILSGTPTAGALRWIDRTVADKRLSLDPAVVRSRLLDAELSEIRDGAGGADGAGAAGAGLMELLPAVPLDASAGRDAESKLSSAILLGSDRQADLVLCLARRHAVEPDLAPPLQQRLRDFASGWIDKPGGCHPDGWALRAEILDCAHDELRHRATAGGLARVLPDVQRLNRYFSDRADLSDPIDCHIQASLIAASTRTERVQRLRQLLASLASLAESPTLAPVAASAAAGLQRALIEWKAVDGDAAVTILAGLPDSIAVEPVISERAAEQLTRMSQRPSRGLLELLANLDRRGKAPKSGRLANLLDADKLVRAFTTWAVDDKVRTELPFFDRTLSVLCQAEQAVVLARLDDVLAACLGARHRELSGAVLTVLRSPVPRQLVERWGQTLGTREPVADAVWCVSCLGYDDLPDRRRDQLTAVLREYAARLSQQDFDTWYGEVARQIGPQKLDLWEGVFPAENRRSRINLWRNKDGGRS